MDIQNTRLSIRGIYLGEQTLRNLKQILLVQRGSLRNSLNSQFSVLVKQEVMLHLLVQQKTQGLEVDQVSSLGLNECLEVYQVSSLGLNSWNMTPQLCPQGLYQLLCCYFPLIFSFNCPSSCCSPLAGDRTCILISRGMLQGLCMPLLFQASWHKPYLWRYNKTFENHGFWNKMSFKVVQVSFFQTCHLAEE